jgi:hypothetical protein
MGEQLGPTGEMEPREWGLSSGGRRLNLGVSVAPAPARAALPQSYGVALLELLVVDPHFVFISWEIPEAQLAQARSALGEAGFGQRQLELRLRDLAGAVLLSQQLYGEIGRWFFRHDFAGQMVRAELGFSSGGQFHSLNAAGPLQLPRDYMIEPEQYNELRVHYRLGPDGGLELTEASSHAGEPWPALSLPAPVFDPAGGGPDRSAVVFSGMPSSTGLGFSSSAAADKNIEDGGLPVPGDPESAGEK